MKCPKCEGETGVEQVRKETARRRRRCLACGYQFHTQEFEVEPDTHGGERGTGRSAVRDEAIRAARLGGKSTREVAKIFDVCHDTVRRAMRARS